jgi:hypothetical protein
MTDLSGRIFGRADGKNGNVQPFLPREDISNTLVRGVEQAFANALATELKLNLQFPIANDEFSRTGQLTARGS